MMRGTLKKGIKQVAMITIALMSIIALAPKARAGCIGTCGNATAANGDVPLPPGSSVYQYVTTTGGAIGGGDLPAVFGSPGVQSMNGSTLITGKFTPTAKQMRKFNFDYATSDGSGYPDYAWAGLMSTDGGSNYLIFSTETEPAGNTVPGVTMPPLAPGTSLIPPTSQVMPGSGTQCGSGDCNTPAGGPVWTALGPYSGDCWAIGCGQTGWIQSRFSGEAAGTYQLEFGVSNTNDQLYDSGLALAGCSVVVNGGLGAPSLAYGGTSIIDSFTPNFGLGLSQAASECGFKAFDWQQTITNLPDPSPFYQVNPTLGAAPIHLTSLSTPFNDPPQGGYVYCANTFCGENYPFYYSAYNAINNQNYCITKDASGTCL